MKKRIVIIFVVILLLVSGYVVYGQYQKTNSVTAVEDNEYAQLFLEYYPTGLVEFNAGHTEVTIYARSNNELPTRDLYLVLQLKESPIGELNCVIRDTTAIDGAVTPLFSTSDLDEIQQRLEENTCRL